MKKRRNKRFKYMGSNKKYFLSISYFSQVNVNIYNIFFLFFSTSFCFHLFVKCIIFIAWHGKYLGSLVVHYNYQGHYPHFPWALCGMGLSPKELGHGFVTFHTYIDRNFLLRKWSSPVNSNFQLA